MTQAGDPSHLNTFSTPPCSQRVHHPFLLEAISVLQVCDSSLQSGPGAVQGRAGYSEEPTSRLPPPGDSGEIGIAEAKGNLK